MIARELRRAAALVGLAGLAGCASHRVSAPQNQTASSQAIPTHLIPVTDHRASATPPPANGLPAALAEKTAAFSRALTEPGAQPSDSPAVQWGTPAPAPLSSTRRPRTVASDTPAANASPAAIEPPKPAPPAVPATLASARFRPEPDDGPMIVPESSDFSPGASHASDDLGNSLARRLRANPRDLSAQLDNQLYELLRDDTQSKWTSTSELPSDDRELVAAVVDGLSNLRNGIRQDSNAPMSKLVQPLTDMAARAKAQAGLNIANMTLCRRVDGFGKYDPIDPPRFPAGQANPVLVYCELSNFQSRLDDKHQWETQLQQQVTVFTDTGVLVWKDKQRPVSDECRNHRNDFFLYDLVTLPPNLTIGRYLVKLTIVDKLANRVDESTVPVEVVAR